MEDELVLSPQEQTLDDLICQADLQDDYATATWLAEMLFANLADASRPWVQREHGYYRLVKCLFREHKYQAVRKLMTNEQDQDALRVSVRCRFKLALACYNLQHYVEANSVVEGLLTFMPEDPALAIGMKTWTWMRFKCIVNSSA
jgi:hypothetical protein